MQTLKFLARLAVSVLILAVILRSIDLRQASQVALRAAPEWLLLALLMQFCSTGVAAYRWQLIMRNLGFGQTFSFYWNSYFKGMFFNQGLPTSIGGDALRVLDVAGGTGSSISQVSGERCAGSAASRLLNRVVPVRGMPNTKIGRRIGRLSRSA